VTGICDSAAGAVTSVGACSETAAGARETAATGAGGTEAIAAGAIEAAFAAGGVEAFAAAAGGVETCGGGASAGGFAIVAASSGGTIPFRTRMSSSFPLMSFLSSDLCCSCIFFLTAAPRSVSSAICPASRSYDVTACAITEPSWNKCVESWQRNMPLSSVCT